MRKQLIAASVLAAFAMPVHAFTDLDPLFFPNLAPDTPFTCQEEIKAVTVNNGPGLHWIGDNIPIVVGVPTPSTMTIKAGEFRLNLEFNSQVGWEVLRYDDPTYRDGLMAVFDIRGGVSRVVYVMINAQRWRCQPA